MVPYGKRELSLFLWTAIIMLFLTMKTLSEFADEDLEQGEAAWSKTDVSHLPGIESDIVGEEIYADVELGKLMGKRRKADFMPGINNCFFNCYM